VVVVIEVECYLAAGMMSNEHALDLSVERKRRGRNEI
jgi:hypothetical protein